MCELPQDGGRRCEASGHGSISAGRIQWKPALPHLFSGGAGRKDEPYSKKAISFPFGLSQEAPQSSIKIKRGNK